MLTIVAAWATLGAVAGLIAGTLLNQRGQAYFRSVALGIMGAMAGGAMSRYFGAAPVTGLSVPSTIVALVGSIVVLASYYSVSSPGPTDQPPG